MVKIMENPIKMDDLGGKTPIFGNIHIYPPKSEDLNPLVTLSKKTSLSPAFWLVKLVWPLVAAPLWNEDCWGGWHRIYVG